MPTVYGYEIESELPLRRLRPGIGARGTLRVRRAASDPLSIPSEILQLAQRPGDSAASFAIGRGDGALLTWCAATGTARIDAEDGLITALAEGEPDTWEDRLLHGLIPVLLADRGEFMLHAAAILTEAGAVLVCGPSGRGKSSLAAVCVKRGMPQLAEDAVSLVIEDEVRVWPGAPGVRLGEAASELLGEHDRVEVRGKQLQLVAAGGGTEAVTVAAIVALGPRGAQRLELTKLDELSATAEIFGNVFRLERESWKQPLAMTAELVRQVPCYVARFPDQLALLPSLSEDLIAQVTQARTPARPPSGRRARAQRATAGS